MNLSIEFDTLPPFSGIDDFARSYYAHCKTIVDTYVLYCIVLTQSRYLPVELLIELFHLPKFIVSPFYIHKYDNLPYESMLFNTVPYRKLIDGIA